MPTLLGMAIDPNEQWGIARIADTLVGRRSGASAAERAREQRRVQPIRARVDRLLGRRSDELAWRKRALGERVNGSWLGRLPEGWFAFHDIPVGEGGTNVDHVVVGPGGVFTVNTKHLAGAIRVTARTITHEGHRTDYLPEATAEARTASRLLSAAIGRPIDVRPILAILADEWTITTEPADVIVRGPRSAKNVMLAQPPVLRPSDVIVVAAAAAKPATWAG